MVERTAEAEWRGSVSEGSGTMALGSGAFQGAHSFGSRLRDDKGTNPEELIGAAHAGRFSMALALGLGQAGFVPTRIQTKAKVDIEQVASGLDVPGFCEAAFLVEAGAAKNGCPVSQASRSF